MSNTTLTTTSLTQLENELRALEDFVSIKRQEAQDIYDHQQPERDIKHGHYGSELCSRCENTWLEIYDTIVSSYLSELMTLRVSLLKARRAA